MLRLLVGQQHPVARFLERARRTSATSLSRRRSSRPARPLLEFCRQHYARRLTSGQNGVASARHGIGLVEGRSTDETSVDRPGRRVSAGLAGRRRARWRRGSAKVLIYSGTVGYRHANCRRGDPARGRGADPGQAAGRRRRQRLPLVQRARAPAPARCPAAATRRSATPRSSPPRTSRSTTRSSSGRRRRSTATTPPASAVQRRRAGGDRGVRPRRRRHRRDARVGDDGRRRGDVAVVGRAGRQRDRRADAGPLGDRRQQHRDRPGLRPQPPVDEGPARTATASATSTTRSPPTCAARTTC